METLSKAEVGEFGIILRFTGKSFQPYVTHEFRVTEPDNTYWGHYFRYEKDARKDFGERVKNLTGRS
jgi:hypothetical protein